MPPTRDPHAAMNQMLAFHAPIYEQSRCSNCNKAPGPDATLKKCARCHETSYCNKDCQKSHWKNAHKGDKCTFSAIRNNRLLDALDSREQTYQYIIDMYRLRVDDDHKFLGDTHGLYSGDNPLPDFQHFLDLAEQLTQREKRKLENEGNGDWNRNGRVKCGVLPSWWDVDRRKECVDKAADRDSEDSIWYAVEKPDIQEEYSDQLMPMKLRMMAEKIYGKGLSPF
ncbi:hypothetical protein PRK78_000967 [Emydomyces testavorans]|uniref:MYND-type domain-containing protein n=1 Tax=Emydomyces testavorans TaxID=2070801 RepID=A0AAF0DD49_9EURO|nr:hypothetical protein PRK78_000967 [Emydomyces testavorans]